nr:MAG TPA: Myb2 [Caudoviricetes sp.]
MNGLRRNYEELDHSPFTKEEIAIIEREVSKHGPTWSGFKRLMPNRSITDIKVFARQRGIKSKTSLTRSHRIWSEKEDALIIAILETLSKKLQRKPQMVCNHAYRLFTQREKLNEQA